MARSATPPERQFDARPDRADFRDKLYEPGLHEVPPLKPPEEWLKLKIPVLDQGVQGSCTGFGLATVANFLLRTRKSHPVREARVSPRMLYETAKKYDDWPGESYEGSSARGAVKGWHKHGVCDEADWPYDQETGVITLARAAAAADVPLGSYYRVNKADLTAVHAALAEVGVLYVTSQVHTGWDKVGKDGIIPSEPKIDGGHAFALVGYDQDGFWLQNSWGTSWGRKGLARLSYDDWLRDADDAWVCRLGVPVRRTK